VTTVALRQKLALEGDHSVIPPGLGKLNGPLFPRKVEFVSFRWRISQFGPVSWEGARRVKTPKIRTAISTFAVWANNTAEPAALVRMRSEHCSSGGPKRLVLGPVFAVKGGQGMEQTE